MRKPLIYKEYSGIKQKTTLKNPVIFWGGLLYIVGERLNGIQEVSGSIPLISTKSKALKTLCFRGFLYGKTPDCVEVVKG